MTAMDDTQTASEPQEPVTSTDTSSATDQTATEQVVTTPDATVAEQGTETPVTQISAEDTAESKLYAGKYKSVEDLEKSYIELQSKNGRDAAEKAELARTLEEILIAPQSDSRIEDVGSYGEVDPLATKVESLERLTTVQSFIFTHEDADATSMDKILREDPMIAHIANPMAKLEYAYNKSRNESSSKAIEAARQEASNQTIAKVAEKQSAQVEGAGSSTQPDENDELYEKATGNYGPQERKAARLAWLKKNYAQT